MLDRTLRSYFGTDMIGSVRSSTHDDGLNANYYDYDVFGKPFGETSDYGYVGKPYDPVTGLSNYGYRDYSPKTARFTTVDPIRDGHNWYAYCSNDPVNFVDLWGLTSILLRKGKELLSMEVAKLEPVSKVIYKAANKMYKAEQKYTTIAEEGVEFRCDQFVEKTINDAGYKSSDYLAGSAASKTVTDHINNAKENGVNKTNRKEDPMLDPGAYVVFMGDSKMEYAPHAALVIVRDGGSVIFWDNNRNNETKGVDVDYYDNITSLQAAYGYESFYYQKIKNK